MFEQPPMPRSVPCGFCSGTAISRVSGTSPASSVSHRKPPLDDHAQKRNRLRPTKSSDGLFVSTGGGHSEIHREISSAFCLSGSSRTPFHDIFVCCSIFAAHIGLAAKRESEDKGAGDARPGAFPQQSELRLMLRRSCYTIGTMIQKADI